MASPSVRPSGRPAPIDTAAEKAAVVKEVRERFDRAVAMVLLDFRGASVATITDLRKKFRDAGIEYKVVKNNLVRKALIGTPLESNAELDEQLRGPTGIAWSYEDPSIAAKVVRDFRKGQDDDKKIGIKCGILDNTVIASARVETELASLPGKNEVRAQLLATLLAPMQNLVAQLAAPAQNLAYALSARRDQLEKA